MSNVIPFPSRFARHDEVDLPDHPTPKRGTLHSMQAGADAVTVFIGPTELWLSADQAESFGLDLIRFAKAARELAPKGYK